MVSSITSVLVLTWSLHSPPLLLHPFGVHRVSLFFFFNDPATTEIYTLSLHDALPIYHQLMRAQSVTGVRSGQTYFTDSCSESRDRKSTRLNSSHANISYAVFCLKKKKKTAEYAAIVKAIYAISIAVLEELHHKWL